MQIDRDIKRLSVSCDESVVNSLQKMCMSGVRFLLVIAENGALEGVFTDGDLRHWLLSDGNADLNASVISAANKKFVSARASLSASEISLLFTGNIKFIPLIDAHGRLVGVARKDSDEIHIGDKVISATGPAFIIAEVGNNHNGDIDLAKALVDHAIEAGADCVKFQIRNMKALYRQSQHKDGADEDLGTQYVLDLLKQFQLSDENLKDVFDYCLSRGILPMCTPWDVPSVDTLEGFGMVAYKVASADLTNTDLLKRLSETRKPLIVSTGMSDESEIIEAVSLLTSWGVPFVTLHCNSTYPAPFHDLNLRYIERIKEISGGKVGYSGHERGFHAVIAAVTLGAKVIEKHITVDRNMEGNDHKVSLLPSEFKSMVMCVREIEQALGVGTERRISQGEMMNRSTLAKSLVAAREIEQGEIITDEMLEARSPGQGLQPNRRHELVGLKASRSLKAGEPFFASDLRKISVDPRDYSFERCWGVPVRYHDFNQMLEKTNLGLIEFHFSYRDLELDYTKFLQADFPDLELVVHAPELFAGDHIVDLCSPDASYRNRSVLEMKRVISLTTELKRFFPRTKRPVIITNVGGYSIDRQLTSVEIRKRLEVFASSIRELDQTEVEIIPQTMPPYPWHFGGQRFHNLFVDAEQTESTCKELNLRVCLDVSHSKLACNHLKHSFEKFLSIVGPYTAHLHIADSIGLDGEGLQIGDGDMDFRSMFEILDQTCASATFIPEVWQGHVNGGEGFWIALDRLEKLLTYSK